MKIETTILALASVIVFGCSSPKADNKEIVVKESEAVVEIAEEEDHNHEQEAIMLDNGNKWKVVEGMLIYIRNMEEAVNNFEGDKSEDYVVLAQTIDENIRELTSNCTMEGQAHDELHKWLVPFIGLSEEFDAATELTEQKRICKGFEDAFVAFNSYFE